MANTSTRRFVADPVHSSFGFAVRHMGVSTFRGHFEVGAALSLDHEVALGDVFSGLLATPACAAAA